MDLIEALNDLPAPLWTLLGTLLGATLGVFGTLRVEKFRQRAEREKAEIEYRRSQENALEERMRDAYIEVIALARDLREGTLFERSNIIQEMPWAEEHLNAVKALSLKLRTLNTAILRASVESTEGMRGRLKALYAAANEDVSIAFKNDADDSERREADDALADAINTVDKAVHMLFDPELVFPKSGVKP